ncbi:fumarylacetoacetate hydrolase family protein [Fangia hongkongensis]|uniref:fumarylacetoacetate hydrolase family protein n=1 Tax=Fangia hongkongensis TaxID=270495 RepID=UPI00035D8870|nr:fumarylacetoacetate hydrolase family protein [Fangia hongkongensis]MBK2125838.1 fumarylacetoacetate hydrolase family protein [Fangia hongkongensis]
MKLVRYGNKGSEKAGMVDHEGKVRDLSAHIHDIDGHALSPESLDNLKKINPDTLPLVDENTRIAAPVANVGKLICVGLNFYDHAKEMNMAVPTEPVLFNKFTSAICGAYDDIVMPPNAQKVDWEVELAIVIGKEGIHIPESKALDHIAGFCLANDVSERSYQLEKQGHWTKGKSYDNFAPLGPWLVTPDEIEDVNNLSMTTLVNGVCYQKSNTNNMIFSPAFLIAYISQFGRLLPGDVIITGTPAGVGVGHKPQPVFLKAGDQVEISIEKLGKQSQFLRSYECV